MSNREREQLLAQCSRFLGRERAFRNLGMAHAADAQRTWAMYAWNKAHGILARKEK